jgi:hypothetical protein
VRVIVRDEEHVVPLHAGAAPFLPSFAIFSDFPEITELPTGVHTVRVVVEPPDSGEPIWAFITVTNNDTQQITTITPD